MQHSASCYGNRCSCGIRHRRTTPHLQLASQAHRWDGTAQRRCRGEHWPNPCYTNMLTCKPHPTPVHFTKEPTLWGSSQWLALQSSSSGPRRSAHVAELYVSDCPWHLSLPMSHDQAGWAIGCGPMYKVGGVGFGRLKKFVIGWGGFSRAALATLSRCGLLVSCLSKFLVPPPMSRRHRIRKIKKKIIILSRLIILINLFQWSK